MPPEDDNGCCVVAGSWRLYVSLSGFIMKQILNLTTEGGCAEHQPGTETFNQNPQVTKWNH